MKNFEPFYGRQKLSPKKLKELYFRQWDSMPIEAIIGLSEYQILHPAKRSWFKEYKRKRCHGVQAL